jgi:hypothetical protein
MSTQLVQLVAKDLSKGFGKDYNVYHRRYKDTVEVFNDGNRVILKEQQEGTVVFDGTLSLLNQLKAKGYARDS